MTNISDKIEKWREEQQILRDQVVLETSIDVSSIELIAGMDISFYKGNNVDAVATIVVFDYKTLQPVFDKSMFCKMEEPYISGFLAFREKDHLIKLWNAMIEEFKRTPDVVLIDGNGIHHQERCGLACHFGLKTGVPTIGVAKNFYSFGGLSLSDEKRIRQEMFKNNCYYEYIKPSDSDSFTCALVRSNLQVNPVYVSPGHLISLKDCIPIVMHCCKNRVPCPIAAADRYSRNAVRESFC